MALQWPNPRRKECWICWTIHYVFGLAMSLRSCNLNVVWFQAQYSRSFSLRPDRPGNVPVSAGVVLTSDDFAPSSGGIWQGLEMLWGQRMGGLLTSGGVTARDSPRSTKDLSPNVNSAKVEKPWVIHSKIVPKHVFAWMKKKGGRKKNEAVCNMNLYILASAR